MEAGPAGIVRSRHFGTIMFRPSGGPTDDPPHSGPLKKNKKKKKISIFVTIDFVAIYTCPLHALGYGLIQGKLGGLDSELDSASIGTGFTLNGPVPAEPARARFDYFLFFFSLSPLGAGSVCGGRTNGELVRIDAESSNLSSPPSLDSIRLDAEPCDGYV